MISAGCIYNFNGRINVVLFSVNDFCQIQLVRKTGVYLIVLWQNTIYGIWWRSSYLLMYSNYQPDIIDVGASVSCLPASGAVWALMVGTRTRRTRGVGKKKWHRLIYDTSIYYRLYRRIFSCCVNTTEYVLRRCLLCFDASKSVLSLHTMSLWMWMFC